MHFLLFASAVQPGRTQASQTLLLSGPQAIPVGRFNGDFMLGLCWLYGEKNKMLTEWGFGF